ncbi:MAG: hypothetical protein AAF605_07380 [Myxococcota bacterium]
MSCPDLGADKSQPPYERVGVVSIIAKEVRDLGADKSQPPYERVGVVSIIAKEVRDLGADESQPPYELRQPGAPSCPENRPLAPERVDFDFACRFPHLQRGQRIRFGRLADREMDSALAVVKTVEFEHVERV